MRCPGGKGEAIFICPDCFNKEPWTTCPKALSWRLWGLEVQGQASMVSLGASLLGLGIAAFSPLLPSVCVCVLILLEGYQSS